ncbi:LOW QUALITY PROTEIN: F-box protein PP2-B11, partial [Eutrema salsugineum]|uniref:LOW QUALITY PROTEIN: F-box protein PP2-B11 n=1 Tax=Eutrema salsugineum TaxID=72664 RepID=UPI000CED607B
NKITCLASPRDVCRSSAVSTIFRSAADSDGVWNHFLPSEFPDGFAAPEAEGLLPNRKGLFFSLVHNPLLLPDALLSFWLERRSGNKCYMIAARALNITWGHDQKYWEWISLPDTRFTQVAAELIMVWWLDITGKLNINLLSDDTHYAAYLVFKWNHSPYGFRQPVEASLALAGTEPPQPSMVSLMQNRATEQGHCSELRTDGWYEVKQGHFFKRRGDLGEIEMNLKETKGASVKKGLIVHGIKIRPLP